MASSVSKVQLRGHCQCCGREQAVPNGHMSKHGYEVKNRGQGGWFSGVCGGDRFEPIEKDRKVADSIVVDVRRQCAELRALVVKLQTGKAVPTEARSGNKIPEEGKHRWQWKDEMVPYAQAPEHEQQEALRSAIWSTEQRAKSGEDFANQLEKIANEYHGKPLIEIKASDGPEPIAYGEKRIAPRGVLTAGHIYRGMVEWKDEKGYGHRMSTRSWRLLPKAEVAS